LDSPSPKGWIEVGKHASEWQIYRTRFLIRARQLTEQLVFRDALGREHCGREGDYLVESSDGTRRIAPREIFEDVYVAMGSSGEGSTLLEGPKQPAAKLKRRSSARTHLPCELGVREVLWKSPRSTRHPTC